MIDRKIGPIKIKRGTDSERLTKVFESGELVYSTDKYGIYIGDDSTYGGISITNRNYTLSSAISTVPTYAKDGDIIYSNNNTYMVAQSAGSLKLFQIGNNFDYNTITALSVQQNSISASNLSWNSVKTNGGVGLDTSNGLYIQYDPTKFSIVNGYLKALPFNYGTIYNFNTLNGAMQISPLNQVSISVDNTTIKLSGNKLMFDSNAISASDYVNTTIFQTYTANQAKSHSYVTFDPTYVRSFSAPFGFSVQFTYNSNLFTVASNGPVDPDWKNQVFRIPIIMNKILDLQYAVYRNAMKVLSVIDNKAYGIMYDAVSPYGVTFAGTGNTDGIVLQFEPKVLDSQNVKYVNAMYLDLNNFIIGSFDSAKPSEYEIRFENNFADPDYCSVFSVVGYNQTNGYGKQTTAHIPRTLYPTVSTLRIETGYHDTSNNKFVLNPATRVSVEIYGNPTP